MNENDKTTTVRTVNGEHSAKQSTSVQVIAIAFILGIATKTFMLPVYLIRATGRDAYIVQSIYCIVELIMLAMYIGAMYLSPDTDIFELISRTVGKVCARIIAALVGIYTVFRLTLSASETMSFFAGNVSTDFSIPVMAIMLMIFLVIAGKHTLRALCRLNEFVVPVIVLCSTLLVVLVVATGFDFANILPAMQKPETFVTATYSHAVWLGDFTPLLMFIGRTKIKKHTGAFVAISGTLSSAVTVFISIIMCSAFGNVTPLVDAGTNLAGIFQFSLGNVYGRVDMIMSVLWSVGAFIEIALFFYCAVRCFAFTVGKRGETAHFIIGIIVAAIAFVPLVFVFTDSAVFSLVVTNIAVSAITGAIAVALPIFVLICAAVNRAKGKRETTGNDGKCDSLPPVQNKRGNR